LHTSCTSASDGSTGHARRPGCSCRLEAALVYHGPSAQLLPACAPDPGLFLPVVSGSKHCLVCLSFKHSRRGWSSLLSTTSQSQLATTARLIPLGPITSCRRFRASRHPSPPTRPSHLSARLSFPAHPCQFAGASIARSHLAHHRPSFQIQPPPSKTQSPGISCHEPVSVGLSIPSSLSYIFRLPSRLSGIGRISELAWCRLSSGPVAFRLHKASLYITAIRHLLALLGAA